LSSEELAQVYQILFPVLAMYDLSVGYDRALEMTKAYNYFLKRGW